VTLHRRVACVLVVIAAAPAAAADDVQGRKLFTETAVPACAVCHTLAAAGATGAVGPPLDELKPDAARVATALRNGVGSMPSYKATLSEQQIELLARYVARASGAQK